MSSLKASQSTFRPLLLAAVWGSALVTACVADAPGISDAKAGKSSSAGANDAAGEASVAGTGGSSSGGAVAQGASGGTASSGGSTERAGASSLGGSDSAAGGAADLGGAMAGGAGGSAETPVAMSCVFHTDALPPVANGDSGGSGGGGGSSGGGGSGGGSSFNVVVQASPFLGGYLSDGAGRTLYTYGGDLPGDCKAPPTSHCEADCAVSWPAFDAGARALGPGLDDAAFGTIKRADGSSQATYFGWPLYYYKADLSLGQLTGQGKGKTWHAAQLRPPAVTIMKTGTAKYLADAAGHTLYVSAADQAASGNKDPVSSCDADCLDLFEPFRAKALSVVSSLDPADFSVFVRHGQGGLQVAYKGLPLYRADADMAPGDMKGTANVGFTAAVP